MCKQYYVEFTSDRIICGSNKTIISRCSSLRSAKSVIRKTRKDYSEYNARDFRVYDTWAEIDVATNHVPCIYFEP